MIIKDKSSVLYFHFKKLLINTLNPVGHQSTNWTVLFILIAAIDALTSFGTTSPRYNRQTAMYFPCRGSTRTIWQLGSKHFFVISSTETFSWYAYGKMNWVLIWVYIISFLQLYFPFLYTFRIKLPYLLTWLDCRLPMGSEFLDKEPNLFEIRSSLHSKPHQTWETLWSKRWSGQWVCSNWCK